MSDFCGSPCASHSVVDQLAEHMLRTRRLQLWKRINAAYVVTPGADALVHKWIAADCAFPLPRKRVAK